MERGASRRSPRGSARRCRSPGRRCRRRTGVSRELAEERAVAEVLERADLRSARRSARSRRTRLVEAGRLGELGGELHVGLLAAGARDLAVALHQLAEAVDVDGLAALLGELLRQLDREAVGGGEREGVLARDRLAAGELLELLQAALQRLAEALLLDADDARRSRRRAPSARGRRRPSARSRSPGSPSMRSRPMRCACWIARRSRRRQM